MRNKDLRIFVDAHCLDKEYQGTNSYVKGLYTAMMNIHPEIDICFGAHNPENIFKAFPGKDPKVIQYRSKSQSARLLADIPTILKKRSFDFAHFQNIAPLGRKNCKYVLTLHDVLFEDYKEQFPLFFRKSRSFFFKKSITNAQIKTTVSTYSKQRIALHYSIQQNDIHVIANAGNHVRNSLSEINHKPFKRKYDLKDYILYVSRIEPRKNHAVLIKAWKSLQLCKQGIRLVFIGHYSIYCKALEKELSRLTYHERSMIHFLSDLPEDDLEHFYLNCRLFVYPSLAEGFGIPPIEAALYRKPVICSNRTAMMEYDFFSPYFFNPEKVEELCSHINTILEHPPCENQLKSISEKVSTLYNWEKSAEQLYQLLITNCE